MLTRAIAGCLVGGLCLVAASELTVQERTEMTDAARSLPATGERGVGLASFRIASGLARPVQVTHAPGD